MRVKSKQQSRARKYVPSPKDTRSVVLSPALRALQERLARNAHEVWSAKRLSEGWRFGRQRDDKRKKHPCLVPYDELPRRERDYDRVLVGETLKVILALGYRITRSPRGTG
jgi:hypothetical protein